MMRSLNVTHKLLLSFTLVALLVGGLGYLAYVTSGWVGQRVGALDAGALAEAEHLGGMALAAQASRAAMHELAAARATASDEGDPSPAAEAHEALAGHLAVFARHLGRAREQATARDDREALARAGALAQAFAPYQEMATRYADLSAAAPAEAALVLDGELEPYYFGTLAPALNERIETVQAALTERADAAERALFLKLLGVSGVGPKLALALLSVAMVALAPLGGRLADRFGAIVEDETKAMLL